MSISLVSDDGLDAFPMELWDTIFLHLDANALFQVAGVCRPFNELAILILLFSNGVTRVALNAGKVAISARFLPALLRARFLPPLKSVIIAFETLTADTNFSVQLQMTSTLVERSTELLEVGFRFPAPKKDEELTTSHAISAMIDHTPFVTLVTPSTIVPCPTEELQQCYRAINTCDRSLHGPWTMSIKASMKLHFMTGRSKCFMTIIANEEKIEELRQGPENLFILGQYIDLFKASYTVFLSWTNRRQALPGKNDVLFRLPDVLPNLKQISTVDASLMLDLLYATRKSPPRTISCGVPRDDENPIAFEKVLREISQSIVPIRLEMLVSPRRNNFFTEGDLTLPKALHCVESVTVRNFHLADCVAVLSWLAELPAVTSVVFACRDDDGSDVSEFVEHAKYILTLPQVEVQL
ncbi:hypothetical protein C8R45DRAFT_1105170 [Mycena sanguinolenta]|nr:hypothetical protein C8R45DRAFT_1105170 [Mycena sanguinolenta]